MQFRFAVGNSISIGLHLSDTRWPDMNQTHPLLRRLWIGRAIKGQRIVDGQVSSFETIRGAHEE
jgi:hypothetical protein